MGVVCFQGMAHRLMRHPDQTVTHVPGLICYHSTRSVPPAPARDTTNKPKLARDSGCARPAQGPERGRVAVVAAQSTGEGGEGRPKRPTGGQATPGRTRSWTDRRERRGAPQPSPPHASAVRRTPPALRERGRPEGIGWRVEADGRGDVDRSARTRRPEVLRRRVNAGRSRRRIGKWLRAGIREDGEWHHPETGVVQGGVISPGLANRVRHHVLEAWCAREVRPRRQGRGFRLRVADECVMGCELETDARKIMTVLPKRFARVDLSIHPTKTALIAFRKPNARQASADGNGTCDFLGLTHDWTQSRRGVWVITRRTARKRLRRTKKSRWRWCRLHRHAPLKYQCQMLCLKWRGHFRYDGIRGNFRLLEDVRRDAEQAWRY
jgi:Reverse transcriptase (RNA-dependent DNA polymerase)